MSDGIGKKDKSELDDFWDISDLIPKRAQRFGYARSTSTSEITAEPHTIRQEESQQSNGTIIKKYIPPHSGSRLSLNNDVISEDSYSPTDSLIHKVTLKKLKTSYNYYSEFLADAIAYIDRQGQECEYVPYFSYVPQYDQLNEKQLEYYFWFRQNARNGICIKADDSYVLLYIYELINLGDRLDVKESQKILTFLWSEYGKTSPSINAKLSDWLCDFSLLHRLGSPEHVSVKQIDRVNSLKEFYIFMRSDDLLRSARSVLRFCTSYDYRTSKFFDSESEELFDTHVLGTVVLALRYCYADGRMLSDNAFEDSRLSRDAYAGALCASSQKYRIEVEYCSFSRTNELRYLIGDTVKYAENKIRAHIGIKSKMTVYSMPTELKTVIDGYFEEALPKKSRMREREKIKKIEEYEAKYDIPKKPLSIVDAERIESESWNTTRVLVEAFEMETETDEQIDMSEIKAETATDEKDPDISKDGVDDEKTLKDALEEYFAVLSETFNGHKYAIGDQARKIGKMPDALADEINEIAFDIIGDSIIEETEDGGYAVIEDYRDTLADILLTQEDN